MPTWLPASPTPTSSPGVLAALQCSLLSKTAFKHGHLAWRYSVTKEGWTWDPDLALLSREQLWGVVSLFTCAASQQPHLHTGTREFCSPLPSILQFVVSISEKLYASILYKYHSNIWDCDFEIKFKRGKSFWLYSAIHELGSIQSSRSSKEMYEVKYFYRQKVTEAERQKADWLLQGHFPLGDGRGM